MLSFDTLLLMGTSVGMLVFIILYVSARNKFKFLNGQYREVSQKHNQLVDRYTEDVKSKDNEIKSLNEQIKGYKSIPDIPRDMPLEQRIEILCGYFSKDIIGEREVDYNQLFSELKRAAAVMKTKQALRNGLVEQLLIKLDEAKIDENQHLDSEQAKDICLLVFQLAFATIDFAQDYRSSITNTGSLALNIALGTMTGEYAAGKAIAANFNVHETEKVYRTLLALIKDIHYDNRGLIVNDRNF